MSMSTSETVDWHSAKCPTCKAEPGQPCLDVRSMPMSMDQAHGSRVQLALRVPDEPSVMGKGAVRTPGVLAGLAMRRARELNVKGENALAADLIEMSAALGEYERFLQQRLETIRAVKSIVGT